LVQARFFAVPRKLGYAGEDEDAAGSEAEDAVYPLHVFVPVPFGCLVF
jgi:hypothetical protein